jgi:hypothetical protein
MQRFPLSNRWAISPTSIRALLTLAALAALLGAPSFGAMAQQQPVGKPPGTSAGAEHRGPPPEAVAACKSLASGNACSFKGRDQERTGTCWAPEGKPLACKPKNAQGPAAAGQMPAKR